MVNGHLGASLLKELDSEDIYSLLTGGIPKKHFYLSKKDIKMNIILSMNILKV